MFKTFTGETLAARPTHLDEISRQRQMFGWADICTDESDAGTVESSVWVCEDFILDIE